MSNFVKIEIIKKIENKFGNNQLVKTSHQESKLNHSQQDDLDLKDVKDMLHNSFIEIN